MNFSNWQWDFDNTAGEFLEVTLFEEKLLPVQLIQEAVARYPQYTKYEIQRELSDIILYHKKRDLCKERGHQLVSGHQALPLFKKCVKCGSWQKDEQLI